MKNLRDPKLFQRFRRDRRGATIILFAILLIPALAFVGSAIDYGRAYVVNSRIQAALDSAVLAAAASSSMSNDERIAYAQQVFAANYPASELGTVGQPNITIDTDGKITGTVSANLDSTLMGVVGIDNIDIGGYSEAQVASIANGEIVLVLDYSGSMWTGGKYQSMRDAATELINLLSQNGTNTDVSFGLVPFSEHVYGSMESDFIINESAGGTWTNCTRDRKWSYNVQDSTPLSGVDASKWGMECSGEAGEESEEDEEGGGSCNPYSVCSNYPSRNLVIQPLTNNFLALTVQLAAMTPYANTHISLGMAMGWHLLSPNAPWQEGVAYGTEDVVKAIILLTDGRQTTRGWGSGGSHSVSNAENNLEDICEAIKAQGVTVITVAFDLDDADTETRLSNCATSSAYFFNDIDTGGELVAAFEAIAGQLAGDMRLTK